MSEWTPEPWRVTSYEGGWTGIGSERDGLLFKLAYNNEANAPRAVECVDGCKDIEDPETTVPELREVLRELHDIQNGPPLIRHKTRWETAMKRALAVLVKAEPKSA